MTKMAKGTYIVSRVEKKWRAMPCLTRRDFGLVPFRDQVNSDSCRAVIKMSRGGHDTRMGTARESRRDSRAVPCPNVPCRAYSRAVPIHVLCLFTYR